MNQTRCTKAHREQVEQACQAHDLGERTRAWQRTSADGTTRSGVRLSDWIEDGKLGWYGGSGHEWINLHLRRVAAGEASPWHDPEQEIKTITLLDELMRPLDRHLTLFRGVRLDQPLSAGQQLVEPGFMSVSALRSVARSFARPPRVGRAEHAYVIQIEVPAGTPFVPLSRYMSHEGWRREESELLLGRGMIVHVDQIDSSRSRPLVQARLELPAADPQPVIEADHERISRWLRLRERLVG